MVRIIGRRRSPEMIFFVKDSVLLNITKCDLQLYDTYLKQWIVFIKRDYQIKHKIKIEIGKTMIRIRENYLGDVTRAAWEAFKDKFSKEVARIASQGNNILHFYYVIHRMLTARDTNTSLYLRQKEIMRDLEQLKF